MKCIYQIKSRTKQLKLLSLQSLAILIFAVTASIVPAGAQALPLNLVVDRVVFPTGDFPTDVENVQTAVDLGGSVLLKATDATGAPIAFNFGAPLVEFGQVELTRDVTILGETFDGHMTTIRGGFVPFLGTSPVQSTIRGIHFDEPTFGAMILMYSTGADISDNRITNVIAWGDPYDGYTDGLAIYVDEISGTLCISNNVIRDVKGDISGSILLYNAMADTEIIDNHIEGANTFGIWVSYNTHPVLIKDNVVIPGQGESTPHSYGNGIVADTSFGGSFHIYDNTVVCENVYADGIILADTCDSVIKNNNVDMLDSLYGAITLAFVSNSYVGQNKVKGTGVFALDVFSYPGFESTSNTFVGNNIAQFKSTIADVFLDIKTEDTVLVGYGGTVIDLGTRNRITGFTRIGHNEHIGQQIREAQALKREALMEAVRSTRIVKTPE